MIFSSNVILIFSEELLEEFLEVTQRPKFRRFFSQVNITSILETIEYYAEFVKVESRVEVCRDPKDNFLLSLSIDSNADYLITGDKDLLDMIQFKETKITTITEFLTEKITFT